MTNSYNGNIEDCKSLTIGSIPVLVSLIKFLTDTLFSIKTITNKKTNPLKKLCLSTYSELFLYRTDYV